MNLIGDYSFTCDTLRITNQISRIKGNSVYSYIFAQRISNNDWPEYGGVMHGYEIEYVFGLPLLEPEKFSKEELKFTEQIVQFWSSFAETG
ncbi:unnamed protein product [Soboliphyme baturini]|uniref:Acetylcholinesterase n=1 Tax=Soboliphyme baturini TaxID=241478 RepID=A0A183JB59_9BILA|nr:unnamed protein product [Soboliphyme baturini]